MAQKDTENISLSVQVGLGHDLYVLSISMPTYTYKWRGVRRYLFCRIMFVKLKSRERESEGGDQNLVCRTPKH